jgi:xanthine dehydrogenase small subunit
LLPQSLEQLFAFWSDNPAAVPICGGTDIMVQVNISRRKFPALLDLTQIPELRSIKLQRDGLHIGATATYSDVYNYGIVKTDYPCFASLIRLIASEQIRNSGSIVGNIANASPIGDSLPLLLVLEASLVLQSADSQRTIPMKDFFLSYRNTALKSLEIIREIIIPPFHLTPLCASVKPPNANLWISPLLPPPSASSSILPGKSPKACLHTVVLRQYLCSPFRLLLI